MRIRGIFISFALLTFFSLIHGCDKSSQTTATQTTSETFRVAVVVPGTTADAGWNFSAKEAALAIQKELNLPQPVSFVENLEQSRRKPMLRDYGRDGYQLVLCHGYEFNPIVKEIAGEFPHTTFIISGYDQPDDRFGSIVYQLGEAAYLCGAMAAKLTHTGQVGFIAAQQVPPVELCYQGFSKGFLKYKPDGAVRSPVYIEGSHPWEDSGAAKEKTKAMLRVTQPAAMDVLFQNADAASRGIFEAVEAQPNRTFVFGSNRDQNDTTATKRVVASAVIHIDRAFVKAAKAVRDGTYKPHVESETIASGVIECIPSPRLSELAGPEGSQAALTAMRSARDEIVSGALALSNKN